MASVYGGKHVKAWHTNYPSGALRPFVPLIFQMGIHTNRSLTFRKPPTLFSSPPWSYISHLLTPYTAAEKAGLERSKWFNEQGIGYYAEQTTQPQTLGYGLADSPAGLLAWIYEKLVNWTDKYPWEDDEGINFLLFPFD